MDNFRNEETSNSLGFSIGKSQVYEQEEESPSMRSVSILGPPSFTSPALLESKNLSFGKDRPSFGKLSRSSGPGVSRSTSSGGFGVAKEWSGLTSPAVWSVTGDDLELIPDFPLERTHREINDGPSVVAKRISEVLRVMSIETEYCERAKAKCMTNDCVCFRIRLYAGNETGEPVVVEIQRRSGSASSFMRSCRAILDAAEGKCIKMAPLQAKVLPPFMSKPIGQMKCLSSVAPTLEPSNVSDSLNNVMDMLRSKKRDVNVLGLENLVCLTDPIKSSLKVATQVSKYVVIGDDKHDVREEIRVLIDRDVFAPEDDEALTKHADHLRHLSLNVFANALSVCDKDGCLKDAMEKQTWFAELFLPCLMCELKRADCGASNAYQAACCLLSLLSASDVATKLVFENDGIKILESAHAFGLCRHELLANETRLCLVKMNVGNP